MITRIPLTCTGRIPNICNLFSLQQLSKSTDLGVRGVDMNPQEGNLSPSQTPWGSRSPSPSPYPSPDINEDSPEVLSGPDVEVMHVTRGFRPIPSTEKDVNTPDSPTEGILPVGGVVKGHSLPGAKNEPLAKVRLEKNLTERQRSETLKAFVVIDAKSKRSLDDSLSIAKESIKAKDLKGKGDPCGGKMDDDVKEPSEDKMDGAKESIRDSIGGIKEPSGDKMDDDKSKVFSTENVKDRGGPPDGVLTGEKGPSGGIMEDIKRSSWYIIEGSNGEEKTVDNCNPDSNGDLSKTQEQFSNSGESNREDKGIEKVVLGKLFTIGHRRVASSPPVITVSSAESASMPGGEIASGVPFLERSRSDSDISKRVKQELDESVVSYDNLSRDNLANNSYCDIQKGEELSRVVLQLLSQSYRNIQVICIDLTSFHFSIQLSNRSTYQGKQELI